MTKLAVFDCDGTLVDGQADVLWAMDRAFQRANRPPPDPAQVRRKVGLSLPVALRELAADLTEDQCGEIAEFYRSSFRARRDEGLSCEPLFDGIAQMLRDLHRSGWLLAVATGKSTRGLNACLAANDIADLFVSLQTADNHPSKPDPTMLRAAVDDAGVAASDVVMIGDTTFDMDMARRANVRAIGVAWGYHEAHELTASGAVSIAHDAADLLDRLEHPG